MNNCGYCNDTNAVWKEHMWQECICVTRLRFQIKFKDFLPAPPNIPAIKPISDKITLHEKSMLTTGTAFKLIIPKMQHDFYKTLLIYYLNITGKMNDFVTVTTHYLIDLYLDKVEDQSEYDFNQKTIIILHGFSNMGNRQELNIMQQFVDNHKKQNILAYSKAKDTSAFNFSLLEAGFKLLK